MFTVTDSVTNKSARASRRSIPYAYVARDGVPKTQHFWVAARRLCRRRRRIAERSELRRFQGRRHAAQDLHRRPAAGSASPTSTGWRPSSRRRTKASTASYSAKPFRDARRPIRRIIASARACHRARRHADRDAAPVRRREGFRHAPHLRAQDAGIQRFDLAIDWGWFITITQPLFWLLDQLYRYIGNFGLAILVAHRHRQADLLPHRQCPIQIDGQDEEGPAGDGAHQGALQGRPAEAASRR